MLDVKKFGKRIAFLRRQNGMSQEKLAGLLGISSQAISKWENGHTMPDTSLLPVLAQIFQCSIDEIMMPAYLFDPEIEEKKLDRMDLQARNIADYIIQQLGSAKPEESIGLNDAAIIEAVRRVHPNLGNWQITRKMPEAHKRYVSTYITVTTPQQELRLVEKVYYSDDKELLGYELFSRYVLAVPQVYCIDFDKKILLMDEVTDSVQGICFDEDSEIGALFRNQYGVMLKEIAQVHAAFWESEDAFMKIGLDIRHGSRESLLAHINGMEQDFLAYREKEEMGRIPKVWNGLRNTIHADALQYFEDAVRFLKQKYISMVEERFHRVKNITIIHGDLHPGNLFLCAGAREEISSKSCTRPARLVGEKSIPLLDWKFPGTSVKMIDMEAVRIGLCTEDLAMFMALHIEPDKERSKPLLDHYYECLCQNVEGYSYEMFMDDYRISIAEAMFYPIRLINSGIYDFCMRDKGIRAYETFVADSTL